MITYNWTISSVDCKPVLNDLLNVVYTVHWRLSATDVDGISAELYGVVSMPDPNPAQFEPFESLTIEIVSGWVESLLSVVPQPSNDTEIMDVIQTGSQLDNFKSILLNKINDIKNPVTISMQLPA